MVTLIKNIPKMDLLFIIERHETINNSRFIRLHGHVGNGQEIVEIAILKIRNQQVRFMDYQQLDNLEEM